MYYYRSPYNTGNEGWIYNDNVKAPEIVRWLGHVVGNTQEDLSRHDKWLCMMYPRLVLLREFLSEDGVIFVTIDDNEAFHLRLVMDEIFGASNFLASIAWEKRYTRSNNAKLFYSLKDILLVYRKSPVVSFLREKRTEKADSLYTNPDSDPRGDWSSSSYVNPATKEKRTNLVYKITNPHTQESVEHPTHAWKYEEAQHDVHVTEQRLWWGNDGKAKYPRLKNFLSEATAGLVPIDVWRYDVTGTTDEAGNEIKAIFGSSVFDTPKPTRLIKRILQLAAGPNSLVLDSFAGSGTTGHAVMQMNQEDGGNRRFILVEMEPHIAQNVTAERLRRVIKGYGDTPGLGGGFRFCTLGEPLFNAEGQIQGAVTYNDLAHHIFFTETGQPLTSHTDANYPFIGCSNGIAYYLLWNQGGPESVLDGAALRALPTHAGIKTVYADGCKLSASRLNSAGVRFKQIPYEVKTH